VAFLFLQKF
jgi:4-aminobutyrate aminotransferase-like enzyme